MPAPKNNEIPDSENWKFIQRFPNIEQELLPLATNLVVCRGNSVETNKSKILSFLPVTEEKQISEWSALWVTIIHTLGLAFTTSQDDLLHTTKLAEFLSSTKNADAFFMYWALKFQFPFAQNKHVEWKEKEKVVQPYVLIVEHLLGLFDAALVEKRFPFEECYLTYEEVILVLMKSSIENTYDVKRNVNLLLENRKNNFDYSALHVQGYKTVESQFADRTRLYFEKIDIFTFDNSKRRVCCCDWQHLLRAAAFISFRQPPIPVTNEATRVSYFNQCYNSLNPDPVQLYRAVMSAGNAANISINEFNLINIIHGRLMAEGLAFNKEFIESFFLSLRAKPFVILSGISGTGKSALPKTMMRILGNEICRPIAVAHDWTDNTVLLGYFDIDGNFIIGEFTALVREAAKNPSRPFFIMLDELNLARVEYYFAQVLSVLESRYFDPLHGTTQYREFLFNHAIRERLSKSSDPAVQELASLKLTPNVYIIGSVNIDETTHPFSRKVLDRANVLEINSVNLYEGIQSQHTNSSYLDIPSPNYFFAGNIATLGDLQTIWQMNPLLDLPVEKTLITWIDTLAAFSRILEPIKMNIGFRVRDEVCIYLYQSALLDDMTKDGWWHRHFDSQLVQKILPRVNGEQGQIETYLVQLFNKCVSEDSDLIQEDIVNINLEEQQGVRFLKSARKLQRMLLEITAQDKPSTSFWTA